MMTDLPDPHSIIRAALGRLSVRDRHSQWAKAYGVQGEGRIFAVCVGKAAPESAAGLLQGLGGRLSGLVGVDDVHSSPPKQLAMDRRAAWAIGSHPLPDGDSAAAAEFIACRVSSWLLTSADTVIVALSGGTSSMIAQARDPLQQRDLNRLYRELLESGLDVTTINSLRRRLTRLHNGGLTAILRPARVVTLLTSDNPQSAAHAVGSGPTWPDPHEVEDAAIRIVPRGMRRVVGNLIAANVPGERADTVEELLTVDDLSAALADAARDVCGSVAMPSLSFEGPWDELVDLMWSTATEHANQGPVSVVVGGECTVRAIGSGTGGRCQHVALAVAAQAPTGYSFRFAAVGTDGRDNIEGVHGALMNSLVATELCGARAKELHAALRGTDSHPLLDSLGMILPGKRTGQNLCDAYVLVAAKEVV